VAPLTEDQLTVIPLDDDALAVTLDGTPGMVILLVVVAETEEDSELSPTLL
jgi:hypothetical protein